MPRDPNIEALAACGHACLNPVNGHARRWAIKRCTNTLVRSGTPPGIAERSATAMAALASQLAQQASTMTPRIIAALAGQ